MITSIALYRSVSHDPYHNLAVEQHLLETVREGQCILYLWQNQNTVVIGRNQNPWKECRTTLLAEEGGQLARRLSGGGAVFHDLGNLNFTFLMNRSDYNLDLQLTVIQEAVRSLGVCTERSGRNDVLAEGRKFSGNAFFKHNGKAYHHGTLLVHADMEKLSRYLNPSKAKLQSKGVDSVRSRVVNLQELNPKITIGALEKALEASFAGVYGLPVQPLSDGNLDSDAVAAIAERNRSWEWNFGQKMPFTAGCEDRFPWGGVQIQLKIESGTIQQVKIFSDAMDFELIPRWEEKLTGCRLDRESLEAALNDLTVPEEQDVCQLLIRQLI